MCKVQMLRALVEQRLTAAAEEIFGLFERTIAEYEEELSRSKEENERQRKLLDAVFNPQLRLHRADVQQLLVGTEEQQEWSSSLDQEDPEPPHIKEEQEELWTSQEGEQLQGLEEADIEFPFTPVIVKSEEEDDEEEAQSSQLHESQTQENREAEHLKTEADGEDCGGSESAIHDQTSPFSEPETDDNRYWEETKEPQSGSNPLPNNEVPVSYMEYNTGETSIGSSEYVRSFSHEGHLQKRTGIQSGGKPFSCSVCDKTFSTKPSLSSHFREHSHEKSFNCSVCQTSFHDSYRLERHMRSHTGEKPFSCSVCGTRFKHKEHLKGHQFVHTGEKPFSCSICGKRYRHKGDLTRHFSVHTGEKPFSCSVCGKRFSHKGNLSKHFMVHTGEKPFACNVCNRKFTRLNNAKKHKCVGESSRDAC